MRNLFTLILILAVCLATSIAQINTSFEDSDGWSAHSSGNWTEVTPEGTYTGNGMYANGGDTNTGARKIGFNDVGDWFELPAIDRPLILSYQARLSSNASGTNEITIQKDVGAGWVDVIVHTATTNVYTGFVADINEPTTTGVKIRLIRTADNRSHYVDDLSVTVDVAAPIELSSFTASKKSSDVALNWSTATEVNNDYFIIEHSRDGYNFRAIGEVKGAGTTEATQNYSFDHDAPAKGSNYYRLQQVDYSRAFTFSSVESVMWDAAGTLEIYPTLISDHATVVIDKEAGIKEMLVHDLTGRLMISESTNESGNYDLDLSSLANGTYLVSLRTNSSVQTTKVVKQ